MTGDATVPDAHDLLICHAPMMTTTDMITSMDAVCETQEQTDVASFAVLEPTADGFRNDGRAGW